MGNSIYHYHSAPTNKSSSVCLLDSSDDEQVPRKPKLQVKARHPYLNNIAADLDYEETRSRLCQPDGTMQAEVEKAYLDTFAIDYLAYKARGESLSVIFLIIFFNRFSRSPGYGRLI